MVVNPRAAAFVILSKQEEELHDCLLYTSDAADERSSVDLGGRRIIKKKKQAERGVWTGIRKRVQEMQ